MEVDFIMFSEREKWSDLPAAFDIMKKYWSLPSLPNGEGQRQCVIILYAQFSHVISCK